MDLWPDIRAQQLTEQTRAVFAKPAVRFTLHPSDETRALQYFPSDLGADLQLTGPGYEYAPLTSPAIEPSISSARPDVVLLTCHGTDLSGYIWNLRQSLNGQALIGVWLWDNHQAREANHRTVLAADFIFPSHDYAMGHLINPASVMAAHVPLCCGLWTVTEATRYFQEIQGTPRSDKLLVNYVDYPFSWRSALLRKLAGEMPEAQVLLMPPQNRVRFFSKSKLERFAEWMQYKSALILPVDRDVSTRVFDGLLAGQVLLVPSMVIDFDKVISPALQEQLGIIRLPDCEVQTIRQANARAIEGFNQQGMEGVLARHRYALGNHMLVHRGRYMLDLLRQVGDGRARAVFAAGRDTVPGLYLAS